MHTVTILKLFMLSQGATFGALAGAILGVASLPLTSGFFPLAVLAATAFCSVAGIGVTIFQIKRKHMFA
jgi:hypothetical protein